MINVVSAYGRSFAGLARYLLHDVQADTSERVAWTHTHNVGTLSKQRPAIQTTADINYHRVHTIIGMMICAPCVLLESGRGR